jgi:PAS domain S-box-containing protein
MMTGNESTHGRVSYPLLVFSSLLCVVFCTELLVMFTLPLLLPNAPEVVASFADSFLLTLAISPAVWFLIVRPLRRAAAAEMSRTDAVLEHVIDGVAILSAEGFIESFNRGAQEMFGQSADEVAGKEIAVLFPQEHNGDDAPVASIIFAGNAGGLCGEMVGRHKSGALFPLDLSVSRVCMGDEDKFVCIMRDTTERKRAEEVVAQQSRELARSNAELEQFAYVSSHDLQEPLRMIHVFLQLLARRYQGKLGSEADEFIGFAVDGAVRMQKLIDDLLDYSRVGTRGKELLPLESGAALAQALDNLRLSIGESGATVTHEPLPTVMADESQLVRLFQNLVGNALKFRGEEPPRVDVRAEREEGKWLFSVRDNGIGIAREHFEKIFLIFQRVYSREEYPGTGIGLAVCKRIVERHGGRIWVDSEPGRGATFFFTLPEASQS